MNKKTNKHKRNSLIVSAVESWIPERDSFTAVILTSSSLLVASLGRPDDDDDLDADLDAEVEDVDVVDVDGSLESTCCGSGTNPKFFHLSW